MKTLKNAKVLLAEIKELEGVDNVVISQARKQKYGSGPFKVEELKISGEVESEDGRFSSVPDIESLINDS